MATEAQRRETVDALTNARLAEAAELAKLTQARLAAEQLDAEKRTRLEAEASAATEGYLKAIQSAQDSIRVFVMALGEAEQFRAAANGALTALGRPAPALSRHAMLARISHYTAEGLALVSRSVAHFGRIGLNATGRRFEDWAALERAVLGMKGQTDDRAA